MKVFPWKTSLDGIHKSLTLRIFPCLRYLILKLKLIVTLFKARYKYAIMLPTCRVTK